MFEDISLSRFTQFEELDPSPSMDDFLEVSDKNYDVSYIVKSDSAEKTAQLIFVTPDKQKHMMIFNAEGRIGIKGFNLYFNPDHILHLDTLCIKSNDGKHVWETRAKSGKFHLKSCLICGRYVSNMPHEPVIYEN